MGMGEEEFREALISVAKKVKARPEMSEGDEIRSDAAVKKILKRLVEDKAKLREKPIAELESEINERIYKLYGLDASDVKVIEQVLNR